MKATVRLTFMALLVAIGTIGSSFLWFPAGVAKAYPIQHAVNVIAGVLLGPGAAVFIAFTIGVIRNILGIGTLLAFPGGMIGAFLSGYLYKKIRKTWGAGIGEIVGTGLIGSFVSIPIATLLMGKSVGAFAFVPPFLISSVSGVLIACLLLPLLKKTPLGDYYK
ncbi:energy coupling factor transporter S component ThiW [Aneurinibacillus thermoaerophilus]|uniref:energy coupling factor transporter S component ThiW n=1 Tax=Aneurinibacillus thermoaerophilus TaxID=143495 RepID=UPI002E223D27|nr:energy coupling factor transporter S component ThiW [Aneurinibacillus thermoaerophilus]MED0677639.1 energy coupling factor transporter S component ThiW [Aneurinibacillus thermoaerophilus]